METVIEMSHAALEAAVASMPLSSVTSSATLVRRSVCSTYSSATFFSVEYSETDMLREVLSRSLVDCCLDLLLWEFWLSGWKT